LALFFTLTTWLSELSDTLRIVAPFVSDKFVQLLMLGGGYESPLGYTKMRKEVVVG
jgi:hypothetical protein